MRYAQRLKVDLREVERDAVHYRSRASDAQGRAFPVLIVNTSAKGLMARCEAELVEGDRLRIALPAAGNVEAEVRWSLGGRIGVEFTEVIALPVYYEMLAALIRG
ncbi:PilZ domain-containing protein [Sphingomonas immobilis]|uniref:PilZ domain-containing protein n=1 Tax=Sphingomonas immobilis TaxID=3063997 RepID=A0ABT9A3I8_9SPHN|nr:PilZ domain-containing protein [Sphingomonas sp. CA1-15]MDO7844393.1 PilZ domain-containing protein [Sphingomonas sp. CA1-15]